MDKVVSNNEVTKNVIEFIKILEKIEKEQKKLTPEVQEVSSRWKRPHFLSEASETCFRNSPYYKHQR